MRGEGWGRGREQGGQVDPAYSRCSSDASSPAQDFPVFFPWQIIVGHLVWLMIPLIIPSIQPDHGQERIFFLCARNKEAEQLIRRIRGAKWCQVRKQWHFEVKKEVIDQLLKMAKGVAHIDLEQFRKQLKERKARQAGSAGAVEYEWTSVNWPIKSASLAKREGE